MNLKEVRRLSRQRRDRGELDVSSVGSQESRSSHLSQTSSNTLYRSSFGSDFADESHYESVIPVVTQFGITVFSQHEVNLRIIKEHVFLLNITKLDVERIKQQLDILKRRVKQLLRHDPNKLNFIYEKSGLFYIKRETCLLRKEYEIKIFKFEKYLSSLNEKASYLEKVIAEEQERDKQRVDSLYNRYAKGVRAQSLVQSSRSSVRN